jgi:glycerophosphoryl diester phosphodiesterase
VIVLGHRGGRGAGWPPENTLEAFERAIAEGADGVELDVRLCASGETVLLHDTSLAHVTGGRDVRPVHRVSRIDLPMLDSARGPPVRIPDLSLALDLCHQRIVNIEVKADAPRRLALVQAVARDLARARSVEVVLSSFDPMVVLACAALSPRVARGMLVGRRTPQLATALPLALRRGIVAAHLEDRLTTPSRIARLRRAGLGVCAWTVNDRVRARDLRRMGLTTVITDDPRGIVDALATL